MKILALDQASRISGWAIFEDNKLIKYGKIDLKSDDIGIRLFQLRDQVLKLIQENNIEKVILEDIYMDGQRVNNVQTFKVLAEVFGVLYELCVELEISVEAVLAGTWKSSLDIKGKTRPEQKRNAQQYVINTYNIKPTQDECDAICIGAHVVKQNTHNWG